MRMPERLALLAAALVLGVGLPVANLLPPTSPLHVSDFTLNLFGKFLAYAILALGLDLLWGYTGVLSLGHGVFFGLGAYAMGMHLMLEIGSRGVYQSALPDFMVWNQVAELPLFWRPFYSAPFTLAAYLGARLPGAEGGLVGATVALVAIFLPGFLLVAGALPLWRSIAARPVAARALAGVNAAVVGLLGAALYDPVWTSAIRGPLDVAIAIVGFTLLVAWRASALMAVAWCVLAAMAAALL